MTTPGGVPNLPQGALTLDTLASKLQDMSGTAMKQRAVERFPSIMDNSTGLSPALDITPFGILTRIWAEVNSLVANADPADIQGPEDLPPLLLEFIEGLPVVGQFVGLLEAILGNYDGDDETLLAIQEIFAPIRALGGILQQLIDSVVSAFTGSPSIGNDPLSIILGLLNPFQWLQNIGTVLQQLQGGLAATFAGLEGRVQAVEAQNQLGGAPSQFDNFNRAAIGSGWTNVTGTLAIWNSDFVKSNNFAAGYYNAATPTTDKHGVTIKLADKRAGSARAFICSDTAMSNYVAVEATSGLWGDDSLRLRTGSSPTAMVTHTQANYLGYQLPAGTAISLRYDDVTNTFTVLKDGQIVPELTWEDVDNIVTHGPTKRETGIVVNCDNSFFYAGYGVTDFTVYDVT